MAEQNGVRIHHQNWENPVQVNKLVGQICSESYFISVRKHEYEIQQIRLDPFLINNSQ